MTDPGYQIRASTKKAGTAVKPAFTLPVRNAQGRESALSSRGVLLAQWQRNRDKNYLWWEFCR